MPRSFTERRWGAVKVRVAKETGEKRLTFPSNGPCGTALHFLNFNAGICTFLTGWNFLILFFLLFLYLGFRTQASIINPVYAAEQTCSKAKTTFDNSPRKTRHWLYNCPHVWRHAHTGSLVICGTLASWAGALRHAVYSWHSTVVCRKWRSPLAYCGINPFGL